MDQVNLSRNIKVHTSDIEWSGEAWICPKQFKHYPAFCRDKAKIMVCSFVLILAEEEKRYLGYLEDLYEDKMGEKMVQVRWFYHNQEVKQMIPELYAHPDEVFNTAHVQWISAECIDSVAAVLTPNHYEKCLAILRGKSSSGTYMCHRELKCKKIKPFSLSKLRGYDCQELLSLLYYDSKTNVNVQESIEENKDFLSEDPARQCNWRTRNRRKYSKPERFCAAVTKFIPENHIEPPVNKLKIKSTKGTASNEHDGSEPSQVSSKFDQENIEFLCQDSGIRGCWFKCKILEISKKNIRVQYIDIHDTDGTGKLEEWIPASRVAIPDKLGMRCAGRPTVRPWPPHNTFDCSFEVGDAVDAWLGDGWWEGVVIGSENSGSDRIEVYFPGESKFVTLQSKDLRPSRDWLHQKWVEIAAKRDILSFISLKRSAKGSNHKLPSLADLENVEGGLNLEKQLRILNADCLVDKENMQSVAKNASNG